MLQHCGCSLHILNLLCGLLFSFSPVLSRLWSSLVAPASQVILSFHSSLDLYLIIDVCLDHPSPSHYCPAAWYIPFRSPENHSCLSLYFLYLWIPSLYIEAGRIYASSVLIENSNLGGTIWCKASKGQNGLQNSYFQLTIFIVASYKLCYAIKLHFICLTRMYQTL